MAVGMAISRLIDPPDRVMKFELEDGESSDALWYMSLTNIEDHVRSFKDLTPRGSQSYASSQRQRKAAGSKVIASGPSQSNQKTSKIISIESISDDSESDDFVSYEKPDTDASDSEEDPTLIQRSKPHAPV
jgi:telomere length regulation protein